MLLRDDDYRVYTVAGSCGSRVEEGPCQSHFGLLCYGGPWTGTASLGMKVV
jgi:hypothetical protein